MDQQLTRLNRIIGPDGINKLRASHVAVFGIGGVGGSAALALARSGVGTISLFDHDVVQASNINRQAIANQKTLGQQKTDVLKRMINDIDPTIIVNDHPVFVDEAYLKNLDISAFNYVIDAIDTVDCKVNLIEKLVQNQGNIVTSLGAGNRLDPSKLIITDLSKTHDDPLAKVMRSRLKKVGIIHLDVGFSLEKPLESQDDEKRQPGSSAFVPPAMGLLLASYVVRRLVG